MRNAAPPLVGCFVSASRSPSSAIREGRPDDVVCARNICEAPRGGVRGSWWSEGRPTSATRAHRRARGPGCFVPRAAIGRRDVEFGEISRPMATPLHARRSLARAGLPSSQAPSRACPAHQPRGAVAVTAWTPLSPRGESARTPERPDPSATAIEPSRPHRRATPCGVSRETVGRRRALGPRTGRSARPLALRASFR